MDQFLINKMFIILTSITGLLNKISIFSFAVKEQEYINIEYLKDLWHKSAKETKNFALVSYFLKLVMNINLIFDPRN